MRVYNGTIDPYVQIYQFFHAGVSVCFQPLV